MSCRHSHAYRPARTTTRSLLPGLLLLLLTAVASAAQVSDSMLVPDTKLPIPELRFDSNGELVIQASPTSSSRDFDYLVGNWKLHNRRLKSRLTGSTEWSGVFESWTEMHQILNGLGNVDKYTEIRDGKRYEGVALRLFDQKARLWRIYWADSNSGRLDAGLAGSFENRVGHFFARDTWQGRDIVVVFRWDVRNPELPIWSQAFSADRGKTWEWNMINVSERIR